MIDRQQTAIDLYKAHIASGSPKTVSECLKEADKIIYELTIIEEAKTPEEVFKTYLLKNQIRDIRQ